MEAQTLAALAEPTRLRIVELLSRQPRSVNDIAAELGLRQPQASKHLRSLSQAGLVAVHPLAQKRVYAIRPEALVEVDQWLQELERHWRKQLLKLDDYLEKLTERSNS